MELQHLLDIRALLNKGGRAYVGDTFAAWFKKPEEWECHPMVTEVLLKRIEEMFKVSRIDKWKWHNTVAGSENYYQIQAFILQYLDEPV